MIDFLETTKRHAGLMLTLLILGYIISLVLIQLITSVADDIPSFGNNTPEISSQKPPSTTSPRASDCSVIDGITICPEGVEPPK